jgi:hypothetical protein
MSEAIENLPQEKLESLGAYAKRAREIQIELERLEEVLAKLAEEQKNLVEMKMPEIMMEIGIDEIRLSTGEKLIKKPYYSASIKPEWQAEAFAWLRDNGHDSLIKNEVKGNFGKGEDERTKEIMQLLEEKAPGVFVAKETVHPMTLKSFVKEQCEAGTPPPAEPFSLFIGQKVTIK